MADTADSHPAPSANGDHAAGLGSRIVSSANDSAGSAYAYARRSVDRFVPPSSRQKAYDDTYAYATARPVLFSFIVAQLLFSLLPVLIFSIFALSTIGFALGAAALFALFWIALAFAFLVPAILIASTLAVLAWAWAVGGFFAARWLYARVSAASDEGEHKPEVFVKGEKVIEG